jgi:hypothetical protein
MEARDVLIMSPNARDLCLQVIDIGPNFEHVVLASFVCLSSTRHPCWHWTQTPSAHRRVPLSFFFSESNSTALLVQLSH